MSRSRAKSCTEQNSDSIIPDVLPGISGGLEAVKEGFLVYKKKKRWVVLDTKSIHLFKAPTDTKSILEISLVCSAVRSATSKDSVGFEIVTTGETYGFFCEKDHDAAGISEWISHIQEVCSDLVLTSIGGTMDKNLLTKTYSTLLSREDVIKGIEAESELSEYHYKAMKIATRPENRTCADCQAPRPEWASINLGIFICIDCSGIHRSFGSHISKVRSVKLDKWDDESLENIDKIGNAKANEYWEFNVPAELAKPDPFDLKQRKPWLTMKYVQRRFTNDYDPTKSPVEPLAPADKRLDSQNKRLEELKNAAHEIRKQEYKQIILKLLQDDETFRNEVRILLLKDIDLDLLKEQIEQIKQNESGEKEEVSEKIEPAAE